ncbi:hypothetical protein WJU16_17960 [Chitinophaga pollutisoli]|uniref:Uncharacterized protein n=1 Tax=Chitinophaga pollutisoli TaxID=3133966 RepID=A0ABZ2YJG0_9BACT
MVPGIGMTTGPWQKGRPAGNAAHSREGSIGSKVDAGMNGHGLATTGRSNQRGMPRIAGKAASDPKWDAGMNGHGLATAGRSSQRGMPRIAGKAASDPKWMPV